MAFEPLAAGDGTLEAYEGAVWLTADSTLYTADNDVTRVNSATILTDTASFSGTVATVVTGTLAATEGAAVATTWNPADKSANVTLSNGNLTAQGTNSSDGGVRSTTSQTSGKFYFEVTWLSATGGVDAGCGIATSAAVLTSMGSTALGIALVYQSGAIYVNGTNTGISIGTNTAPVCIALDLTNSRIWFRIGGGNWNNSGTANPATNVGGINISALFPTNAAFAAVTVQNTTNTYTVNFGASAFAQTVPSGFTAWGGLAAGDTAAFTGLTGLTGTLAATEGAKDTAAFAGSSAWLATLAVTEGADTAAFAGTVAFAARTGTLAATEGADTAAFTGVAGLVSGTLAATESADAAAFAGEVAWICILAATEGSADTASFAVELGAIGTLSATEAGDVLAAEGHLSLVDEKVGVLDAYESGGFGAPEPTADSTIITADQTVFTADSDHRGGDTAHFTGAIITNGVIAATEAADVAAFAGRILVTGVLAAAEARDTAAFAVEVVAVVVSGVLAAQEASDTAYFAQARWEEVAEGAGLKNETQRMLWLAGPGRRVTWIENEVEDTSWLQNLEPEVISLVAEQARITELGR
jgi:hypothetical protein